MIVKADIYRITWFALTPTARERGESRREKLDS
jgi:hypothetical protein